MGYVDQELDISQIVMPTPFPVGPVNIFLVHGDPLTVIDAGVGDEDSWYFFLDELEDLRIRIKDIGRVILTHGHTDHIGLLPYIMEETDVEVYGHRLVKEQGESGEGADEMRSDFYLSVMNEFGVPEETMESVFDHWDRYRIPAKDFTVHHTVDHGDTLGPFSVHFVPGHSAQDTIFLEDKSGYCFTGDHLLKKLDPTALLRKAPAGEPRPKCLVEFQKSLRYTRTLPLTVCFPGHGDPFDGAQDVIDGILERHEARSLQVLGHLDDGGKTPYEITQVLYRSLSPQFIHMGLSDSIGHLEVLEERGDVRSELRDGTLYFMPAS